jgi:hypothetical protein
MPESRECSRLEGVAIARYYFHLHDGAFVADRAGVELPDWQSASDHAVVRAGEVISERGAKFWKGEHLRIVVTDAVGTALFELRLSGHLPLDEDILGPHERSLLN